MFIRKANYALSTILAPNGINDSLAILKNCIPNGIPTIVMHQRQPNSRFAIAISSPKKQTHMMSTRNENILPSYTISLPNGQNANSANLKHCTPIGIPIIVMQNMHPARHHASPPSRPPNKNQSMFPNVFICILSLLLSAGCVRTQPSFKYLLPLCLKYVNMNSRRCLAASLFTILGYLIG